jgi:D-psicose/D-tagatose/L-ribulose 3-epimerase
MRLLVSALTLPIQPAVNRSETFLLRTATEAGKLCDAVAHPRVGVTIDTFHANTEEKSIPAAVKSLGPHLRHHHASENDRGCSAPGMSAFLKSSSRVRRFSDAGGVRVG